MNLAENIRLLRKQHNLSQNEIAEKLGYKSYTTIQKWEMGISQPPLSKLQQLADLFEVSINELTGNQSDSESQIHFSDSEPYYLNEETRRIAQEIYENSDMRSLFDMSRKMTPERLRTHLDFMKKLYEEENP